MCVHVCVRESFTFAKTEKGKMYVSRIYERCVCVCVIRGNVFIQLYGYITLINHVISNGFVLFAIKLHRSSDIDKFQLKKNVIKCYSIPGNRVV